MVVTAREIIIIIIWMKHTAEYECSTNSRGSTWKNPAKPDATDNSGKLTCLNRCNTGNILVRRM